MKTCRVSVYNSNEGTQGNEQNVDTTQQWFEQSSGYDTRWWNNDQLPTNPPQQTQQASSSAAQDTVPLIHIAAIRIANAVTAARALQHNNRTNDLRVDSGAVTHVCPPWFSPDATLHTFQQGKIPDLRTAADDIIRVYGYKWIYRINNKDQAIVIPFYFCDVAQPVLSATRLAEQGFEIVLSEQPTVKHPNGFEPALKPLYGLYCTILQ